MGKQDFEHVAVVTGAGSGLSQAFALALSGAGFAVALVARSESEVERTASQVEQLGGRALVLSADVALSDAVAETLVGIERAFGVVDLLVNNAAPLCPQEPLARSDVEGWWHTFAANLRAQILWAHHVLPRMIARKRGRIVNVAGRASTQIRADYSAFVTSETALIRFSECLAAEMKQHGIAVFAMGPGKVQTAVTGHWLYPYEGKRWLASFRGIFDEGEDLPPDRSAALLLALASGKWDSLSGLYLDPFDDLGRIAQSLSRVHANGLYSLAIQRLPHKG